MKRTIAGLIAPISMFGGIILWLKYGLIIDYGTPEEQAESYAPVFFGFGIVLMTLGFIYSAVSIFQFFLWLLMKVFQSSIK
jgi:hypothetical protein